MKVNRAGNVTHLADVCLAGTSTLQGEAGRPETSPPQRGSCRVVACLSNTWESPSSSEATDKNPGKTMWITRLCQTPDRCLVTGAEWGPPTAVALVAIPPQ